MTELINLEKARQRKCKHGNFVVSEDLLTVECGKCGGHVNPVHVLLMIIDNRKHTNLQIAKLSLLKKQIEDKKKTKCRHCGRFTEVRTKDISIADAHEWREANDRAD